MKPVLLIMAAGMGSRYGGLKQLDGVGPHGETLLDYSVFDACQAGFGTVVFVVRRAFREAFENDIGPRFSSRIHVEIVEQELDLIPTGFSVPPDREKPWGTGHAVLCAREKIEAPFCVINADDFYGRPAFEAMARFLTAYKDPAVHAMAGYRLEKTLSDHGGVSRGVCQVSEDGFLVGVEEMTDIRRTDEGAENRAVDPPRALTGREWTSMNFWGFGPSIFVLLEERFRQFLNDSRDNPKAEFYVPAAVDRAVQAGRIRVRVLPTESSWFGITYREDRPLVVRALEEMSRNNVYPSPLWSSK